MSFGISDALKTQESRVPTSKPEPKAFKNGFEAKKFYEQYIDSAEAERARKSAKGMNNLLGNTAEEQVDFGMKIFLASLKNQIPGNETNTDEMVRTLMQMTTTIQQARSNQLLEKGNAINASIYVTGLTKFEGDTVEHPGNKFTFDGTPQDMRCSFDAKTTQATLHIYAHPASKDDLPIRTMTVDPKGGIVTWDGKNKDGVDAPKTDYVVYLVATNADKKLVESKLSLFSKITSTYYDKDNLPVLKAGNMEIREIYDHKKKDRSYKPMIREIETNKVGTRSIAFGEDDVIDFSI